jgi:hypothetical protein
MLFYFRATAECWGKSRDTWAPLERYRLTQTVTSRIPPPPTLCQSATDSNNITVAALESPLLMSFLILVARV